MKKKFIVYVTASMVTMFLQSTYSLIDSVFVSNLINDTALAAITVAWPVIAVLTALGTGIGCGGAVIMSTKQGEGNEEESDRVRANIIVLLLGLGLIAVIISEIFLEPLLILMGARGDLLNLSLQYGRVVIEGGLLQIFSCGLTPLLRNDNKAVSAMVVMICGFGLHLGLDYLFLAGFDMGIRGGAAASLCSQLFVTTVCLIILIRKKKDPLRLSQFTIDTKLWKNILKIAVSPFGISLVPSLLIMYHNIAAMHSPDQYAVSSYALISSTVGNYRVLLIGIAEGIQPLVSFAHGAGDRDGIRWIRNHAIAAAYIVSVLLFVFTLATANVSPAIFGYTGDAAKAGAHAVALTAAQLIFTGMVRVTNSFFYALGKNAYSLIMIYLDPAFLTPAILFILPKFMGSDGIWIAASVAQLILNIIAIKMFINYEKELKNESCSDTGRTASVRYNEG